MAKNKKKKKNPIPAASNLPKNEPEKNTVPAENGVSAEEADFEKELSTLFAEQMTDTAPVSEEDPAAQAEALLRNMSSADSGADKKEDPVSENFAELFAEEAEKLFEETSAVPVDIQKPEETEPAGNDAQNSQKTGKNDKKKNKKDKNKAPAAESAETQQDELILVPPIAETAVVPDQTEGEKPAEPEKPEKEKKQRKQKSVKPEKKLVDEGSPMYLFRLVLVLTIISAVIAGMLAVVNYFTKDIIAENALREKESAVLSVFPEGDSCKEYTTPDGDTVYFAASGEYVIGYCVNVSPYGYSGDIDMMVGIGSDGSVAGIKIVSLSETPGVGTKVNSDSFLAQFMGRTNGETLEIGENVDGIGGATFSSKAVAAGVSEALAVSFDLREAAEEVGLKVSDSVNVPENVADANDDNGDDILMPDEVGEVDENETETTETESSAPETETEPAETETQPVETPAPETETAAPETLPPETQPVETLPVQGEIEAPAVSELEPETEETEETETETETEPPSETLPPETEPIPELPPETEPPAETLPPETEPEPETLPPETETEPAETETQPVETEDIIVDVEIMDEESEETEEPETEETEETETEKETKKNNSSNRGPIIIR